MNGCLRGDGHADAPTTVGDGAYLCYDGRSDGYCERCSRILPGPVAGRPVEHIPMGADRRHRTGDGDWRLVCLQDFAP